MPKYGDTYEPSQPKPEKKATKKFVRRPKKPRKSIQVYETQKPRTSTGVRG